MRVGEPGPAGGPVVFRRPGNRELGVIINDWPIMWTIEKTDKSDFAGGTLWPATS